MASYSAWAKVHDVDGHKEVVVEEGATLPDGEYLLLKAVKAIPHEADLARVRKAASDIRGGIRPVASVTIRLDMLYKDSIDPPDDLLTLLFPRGETHRELYIFKHAHLAEVIRAFEGRAHSKAVVAIWMDGKMFGYSEDAIAGHVVEGHLGTCKGQSEDEVKHERKIVKRIPCPHDTRDDGQCGAQNAHTQCHPDMRVEEDGSCTVPSMVSERCVDRPRREAEDGQDAVTLQAQVEELEKELKRTQLMCDYYSDRIERIRILLGWSTRGECDFCIMPHGTSCRECPVEFHEKENA